MPNDNKSTTPRASGALKRLASTVQTNLDSLYSKTYFTSPSTKGDLDTTKNDITKTIDNIIANNIQLVGSSSIASLYNRLENNSPRDTLNRNKLDELFTDRNLMDGLMNSYIENKFLRDYDEEIDTVLKYCPKLLEALEVRKDNVLSADHFTKDFINVSEDMKLSDDTTFMAKCNEIKEKYDLNAKFEKWYDLTAKYGEVFIYNVPYRKAISRLLAMKNSTLKPISVNGESTEYIQESTITINPLKDKNLDINSEYFDKHGAVDIKVEYNMTGMLIDTIESLHEAFNESAKLSKYSLNIFNEADNGPRNGYNTLKDYTKGLSPQKMEKDSAIEVKSKKDKLKRDESIIDKDNKLDYSAFDKDIDNSSSDGLIDPHRYGQAKIDTDAEKIDIQVPGAVIKKLDRYNIVPIKIEDVCLGYYYFEFNDKSQYAINSQLADPTISLKSNTKLYNDQEMIRQDNMLKYVASKIAQDINDKFVNTNQDLAREIYTILKYNETYNTPNPEGVRVTFLPPDDVEHILFNENEKTHRGISDIEPALFPAKLYAGLYITTVIAMMTRGQDRRVYYVKQSGLETNISEVLLNVIEQIKKFNFNVRQIENINQVLNIIGRFNDFVIPTSPNGDAPVQFEVMQGQDIDPQTDFMQKLEELMCNSVDVPLELIQARQSIDYAVQLTMTNSKFLRKVYARQGQYQKFISRIFTKIYNAEYGTNMKIKIQLPPPMFLNITNVDQLSNNIVNLSQTIADIEIPDGDPNDQNAQWTKSVLVSRVKKNLLKSFIDFNVMDKIKDEVQQEISRTAQNTEEQ